MRPRIYVTARSGAETMDQYRLYLDAIRRAGGEPVLVTPEGGLSVEEILRDADAIVFAGGVDPDPALYGEAVAGEFEIPVEVDAARDALEIPLARDAPAAGVPVLGVCRGAQVLNVASGGTLYQDLSRRDLDGTAHYQSRWSPPLPDGAAHSVRVEPTSRLAAIVGAAEIAVNTFHHQALRDVAPGWRVVGRAPDGVVEAIDRPRSFALGVQWHPERMPDDPRQAALFSGLVEAARRR